MHRKRFTFVFFFKLFFVFNFYTKCVVPQTYASPTVSVFFFFFVSLRFAYGMRSMFPFSARQKHYSTSREQVNIHRHISISPFESRCVLFFSTQMFLLTSFRLLPLLLPRLHLLQLNIIYFRNTEHTYL